MQRTVLGMIGAIVSVVAASCATASAGPHEHSQSGGAVVASSPPVVITARPRMVYVAEFGVAFAPDLEEDVYEVAAIWYTFNVESGQWYRAELYTGPWEVVEPVDLPDGLVKITPGQVRKYYFEHEGQQERGRGQDRHQDD